MKDTGYEEITIDVSTLMTHQPVLTSDHALNQMIKKSNEMGLEGKKITSISVRPEDYGVNPFKRSVKFYYEQEIPDATQSSKP